MLRGLLNKRRYRQHQWRPLKIGQWPGDPSLPDANTSGMEICLGRNPLKSLFLNDIYYDPDRVHALFMLQGHRAAPQLSPPEAEAIGDCVVHRHGPGLIGDEVDTLAGRIGLFKLRVGGATWSLSARIVKMASSPPAAPSRCPVADFVPLTATSKFAPKTLLIASISPRSPSGVEVACALRWRTSRGEIPA